MPDIEFEYIESPPTKWTFSPKKIRKFVENELEGRTLNLFAGKTKLRHDDKIIRNDIDKNKDADYHFDAIKLDDYLDKNEFDTVILDPPWSIRKGRSKYEGRWKGELTKIKEKIGPIVKTNGKVISCGFSSVGMSKKRGFEKEKICLICHGGDQNDSMILVERKVVKNIDNFIKE